MSKKKHPASAMTLRQAFETYYDKSDLAANTRYAYDADLRRWERITGDPAVGKIDDCVMDGFKAALLESGLSAASVNRSLRSVRTMLRRLGPRETKNPGAQSILPVVPYTKSCRETHALPRRLELDNEISRFYIACGIMTRPRLGFPPAFFWQTLCVWLFTTGMRLRDGLHVRFEDVDLERGTVRFTARKTLKAALLPLHPAAVEHVRRIQEPARELIFQSKKLVKSGAFHEHWKAICQQAKIEPFTPHDLRKTAASEINRAAASKGLPPMAGVLLQHSSRSVTDHSYLNQVAELAEALTALRMPIAFVAGLKEAERQLNRSRGEAAQAMKRATLAPAVFPGRDEWDFQPFGFAIRGQYVPMRGGARAILEALATSPTQRCDLETLVRAVWRGGNPPDTHEARSGRICDCIHTVRERLRHAVNLPPAYDPVPCIERGRGGVWTLLLPAVAKEAAV